MWKEPFTYVANWTPLLPTDGTVYTPYSMRVSQGAPFEFLRYIYKSDYTFVNLKLTNGSNGRDLIREYGNVDAIAGTAYPIKFITRNAFLPYVLSVPYTVAAGTELIANASSYWGFNVDLRMAFHGNILHNGDAPYAKRKKKEIYSFAVQSGSVPAYGSLTQTIILDSGSGFLVSKLTGLSTGVGTLLIQDDKKPWSSSDVHFDNMIGNGQFGNLLTSRKWLKEGTMLQIKFTDLSGSTNNFSVTFHGEKLYA